MTERLQKFLASAGVASRRKAEELIAAGRVLVNGKVVTEMGTQVDAGKDLVVVDGRPVEVQERARYLLLYKPPGCVTTLSDPQGRPTVAQYLADVKERVFPVGRLDWDAEGALLFTTDGDLANRLAHPRYGHRRTYLVKVKGDPEPGALARMVAGLRLEDGPAQALEATVHERVEKNSWIRVVVGEGRRHLVKRLCEAVGLDVLRLFRPEFGGISVAGLRPGHSRELKPEEVATLRRSSGMGGEEPTSTAPLRLPRAARRHGHGAPAPRPPRGDVEPESERRSRGVKPTAEPPSRGTRPSADPRSRGGKRSSGPRPRGAKPPSGRRREGPGRKR
ncbi:MAG: pseudouridine synthase [Deltaproteobacteria bacterium]